MTTETQAGTTPAPDMTQPAGGPVTTPTPEKADTTAPDAGLQFSKEQESSPKAEEGGDIVVYDYQPTGDPALDLALQFVGNLGIDASHPAMQAATKGDFGKLDSTLKAMGDKAKGYESYLKVAEQAVARANKAVEDKANVTLNAVYDSVGGKESWNAIAQFVSEHATDAQRQEIDSAFKQGGMAATAMASHLQTLHNNSLGRTKAPAPVVKQTAGRAESSTGALTPRAYVAELRKLQASWKGRPIETHPEYAALTRRAHQFKP